MDRPDAFNLSKLEWDLFVTLSWVKLNLSTGERRKYWFSWLRALAERVGVHFRALRWILRTEFGETTAREHYHAVIGGLPGHSLNRALTAFLTFTWEQQGPLTWRATGRIKKSGKPAVELLSAHCGSARVRLYNPALNGLEYSLPQEGEDAGGLGLSTVNGTIAGANRYEVAKFSGAMSVEYSLSVLRLLDAGRRWRSGWSAKSVQSEHRPVSPALPVEAQVQSGDSKEAAAMFRAVRKTCGAALNHTSVEPTPVGKEVSDTLVPEGSLKCVWAVSDKPGVYARID